MKQNSDTRARRQHSTVPVDKGLSILRLICGLTGNIVRPGSSETPSSMNRRPPCHRTTADLPSFPTASGPQIFNHHGGGNATQTSYFVKTDDSHAQGIPGLVRGAYVKVRSVVAAVASILERVGQRRASFVAVAADSDSGDSPPCF